MDFKNSYTLSVKQNSQQNPNFLSPTIICNFNFDNSKFYEIAVVFGVIVNYNFFLYKSIHNSRIKTYKHPKNSKKLTKTAHISLNIRSKLLSFWTVALPNRGATVHPQTN